VVITPQKFSGLSRNPRFPRGLKLLTKLLAIACLYYEVDRGSSSRKVLWLLKNSLA
jgi:hypothetical protein